MAATNAIWGVEIGQCALKAVKLRAAPDGKVELLAFDLIEHARLLSQPDAEAEDLMRAALEKFASRNEWQGDKFVIGVPGHQTFARFCKLPPVEEKKIPDIVRFEAGQQIPFNMDDVVWDYQVFQAPDMPDVEVGIFAMRKDLVRKHLDRYGAFGITPIVIQTIPSALFNFSRFERLGGDEEGVATVLVDVGAQHTDLVIVEKNSAWTRNIPLGGNAFTETLVKAFKLPFAKAEALKRTAATSKHARQVFQAMRPVFADLVAEIQRSLGFFASTHREIELKNVIACGNAFKLPGLLKYLENNLTVEGGVQRLEKFEGLLATPASNAPQFVESISALAPAYGLALQGLGLAAIGSNLLPPELARVAMWNKKRPAFVAAAACIGLAAAFPWMRSSMDASALASTEDLGSQALSIVNSVSALQTQYREAQAESSSKAGEVEKLLGLFDRRDLLPRVVSFVHEVLPAVNPAVAAADTPEKLKALVQSDPGQYQRTNRRQVFLESVDIEYSPTIDTHTAKQRASAPRAGGSSDDESFSSDPDPGAMMVGGGGRRRGAAPPPPPPKPVPTQDDGGGDSAAAAGGGFYISINGYFTYGGTQVEASRFLTSELIPTIRQLGNVPGRGFFVPDSDPANPTGQNLPTLPVITPRFDRGAALTPTPGLPTTPSVAGTPDATKPTALYPDPVTGEEMVTDWRFQLGFKVKLGDPPAQPAADEATATPEGDGE